MVATWHQQYFLAMDTGRWGWLPTTLVWLLAFQPLSAQTDEIQVYNGEVETPGKFNLTVHANYTLDGRTVVGSPGGVMPQGSLNGAFEWAYGVTNWFEAGTYLPVYTLTHDRILELVGVKRRALFAVPHAEARSFFYAVTDYAGKLIDVEAASVSD